MFFLVEERSDKASKAGLARLARLGDLSMPTAPAYFLGLTLMFVGVVNFGHVPTLRFVVVKNFPS